MPLTLINQLQGKKQVKNLPSAVTNSQEFVVKFLSTETKHQKFVKMLPSRVVSRHQMFTKLQTVLVRLHKSIMNLPRDLLIRSVSLHITIENLQPPKLYVHSHIAKSNGKPQSKSLLNLVNKLNRTPLSTRIHIWIMKLISTSRPMWLLILGQKLNRYSRMFSSMSQPIRCKRLRNTSMNAIFLMKDKNLLKKFPAKTKCSIRQTVNNRIWVSKSACFRSKEIIQIYMKAIPGKYRLLSLSTRVQFQSKKKHLLCSTMPIK